MHIFGELVHIFGKLVHIFGKLLVSRTSKQILRNLGPLWQPGVDNDTNFEGFRPFYMNQNSELNFLCFFGKNGPNSEERGIHTNPL